MANHKADDQPSPPRPAGDDRPRHGEPGRERRSKHRVADDQGSGQGALTALSKLRMLERARASVAPRRDRDGRE